MKLSIALLLLVSAAALVRAIGGDFHSEDDVEDPEDERRGKPKEDKSHRLSTQVLGRSGKIRFSGTGTNLNETVRVEFKDLRERGAGGSSVDSDHRLDDFEDVVFSFTAETNDTYDNLAVRKFSFSASNLLENNDGSKLRIDIFTFKENGIIKVDEVDTAVQVGTVKWNVAIEDWPFCDSSVTDNSIRDCDGDQGEFLDFIIRIGSEGEHEREDGEHEVEYAKEVTDSENEARNRRYRLGASDSTVNSAPTSLGPELILSSKVTVDNVLVSQPDGFPKVEGDAKEQKFIFRFPRGAKLLYDPVLSLTGTSSSTVTVVANAMLVLFATLFATLALRS